MPYSASIVFGVWILVCTVRPCCTLKDENECRDHPLLGRACGNVNNLRAWCDRSKLQDSRKFNFAEVCQATCGFCKKNSGKAVWWADLLMPVSNTVSFILCIAGCICWYRIVGIFGSSHKGACAETPSSGCATSETTGNNFRSVSISLTLEWSCACDKRPRWHYSIHR